MKKNDFLNFFFFFGCLASAKSRGGTFGLQFGFFDFWFDLQPVWVRKLFQFDAVRFEFGLVRVGFVIRFGFVL